MKTSRQRFRDFRDKLRRGLLKGDRLKDPTDKSEDKPHIGGGGHWHDRPSGGNHQFKHSKRELLAEYRRLLRGYFFSMLAMLMVVIVGAALSPITPYSLKLLLDYVFKNLPLPHESAYAAAFPWFTGSARARLALIAVALIAVTLISLANDWIRMLCQQRLNFVLAGSLRQRLLKHLTTLSLTQLSDYKTGGIVSRIMGDTDQVVGAVNNAIITPISAILRIGLVLWILIWTEPRLSLLAGILIPPIMLIHFVLFKRLRPMWRNIQDDKGMLSARLTDTFTGIRVVRSFRRERSEHMEFGARQFLLVRKQQFTAILGRLLQTGWNIFVPAIGVVIIWYGGIMVLNRRLTAGDLVMYQGLVLMLLQPITMMIESFQQLQANMGALDRMIDVLHQPPEMPDPPNAVSVNGTLGHLELRHVRFAYNPEKQVIQDISLDVPAGTMMAIVGPSGGGKTTLVNLIVRFFDVTGGSILLDGKDIRNLERNSYRSLFAMVLQDVYLFDGTVADNIAYGRRGATRAEIIAAARQANAHEFIMEIENNYDSLIGERGTKLSGGQKQRISIARAILANPRILILDEATSSLDSKSEHLIQQSLTNLMRGRTTLVIAHRLSTIMHADQIVVLVDGRIVEQGSHTELLEMRGVYHAMFTQQFERHRDPTVERMEWENTAAE